MDVNVVGEECYNFRNDSTERPGDGAPGLPCF